MCACSAHAGRPQVTAGHEAITALFGAAARPRIAWQIDPFGHSALTPSVFAAAGYDALVLNRVHHADKNARCVRASVLACVYECVWVRSGLRACVRACVCVCAPVRACASVCA